MNIAWPMILPLLTDFMCSDLTIVAPEGSASARDLRMAFKNLRVKVTTDLRKDKGDLLVALNKDGAFEEEELGELLEVAREYNVFVMHRGHVVTDNVYPGIGRMVYLINMDQGLLTEQYRIDRTLIRNDLGQYDHSSGTWLYSVSGNFLQRRSDLKGKHFKVLVEEYIPYLYIDEDIVKREESNKTILGEQNELATVIPKSSLSGPCAVILEALSVRLNFTFTVYRQKDREGGWGRFNKTTEVWTGMMGLLQWGGFDIAATMFSIKEKRARYVDYMLSVSQYRMSLVIPNPKSLELSWTMFFDPFRGWVWALIGINGLIAAIILHVVTTGGLGPSSILRGTASKLWFGVTVHFGHEYNINHPVSKTSEKVAVTTLLILGNVVFISYTASLTSHLSTVETDLPFTNLEELLQSDYILMTTANSSKESKFRHASPDSVYGRIWKSKMEPNLGKSLQKDVSTALKLSMEERAAVYHDFNVISASIPHGLRCEFVRVWSDSHTTQTSMIMRKGSGMEKLFRTATMDIVEGAFYKKDFVGGVMLEPNRPECHGLANASGVGYKKTFTLGILLFAGFVLALILFLAEKVIWALGKEQQYS